MSLKNTSGGSLYLGSPDGRLVADGEVIQVDGDLADDQPDDAYVIGEGDDARAYPKSTWTNAGGRKSKENS